MPSWQLPFPRLCLIPRMEIRPAEREKAATDATEKKYNKPPLGRPFSEIPRIYLIIRQLKHIKKHFPGEPEIHRHAIRFSCRWIFNFMPVQSGLHAHAPFRQEKK